MNKIYINDYLEHIDTISKLETNANNIASNIKTELKERIKISLPDLDINKISSIFIRKDLFWVTFDDDCSSIMIEFKHELLTDNINEVKLTDNTLKHYFVKTLTQLEWERLIRIAWK